jgi:hypothetical protein
LHPLDELLKFHGMLLKVQSPETLPIPPHRKPPHQHGQRHRRQLASVENGLDDVGRK